MTSPNLFDDETLDRFADMVADRLAAKLRKQPDPAPPPPPPIDGMVRKRLILAMPEFAGAWPSLPRFTAWCKERKVPRRVGYANLAAVRRARSSDSKPVEKMAALDAIVAARKRGKSLLGRERKPKPGPTPSRAAAPQTK